MLALQNKTPQNYARPCSLNTLLVFYLGGLLFQFFECLVEAQASFTTSKLQIVFNMLVKQKNKAEQITATEM